MKLQNEYLIIIDEENSSGLFSLCDTEKRFNEYLSKNGNLDFKNKKIIFDKKQYSYTLKMGNVKGKKQLFFYMIIKFDAKEEDISTYKLLLREIKSALSLNNLIIETLRDDLSFFYSRKAYSLIHNIENLMRKFITYFMVTNIGKNWVESSPDQIKSALDKSKRKQYIDVLQQLDFIHLGDFLFKSYQDEDISKLFDKIKSIEKTEEIDIQDLKGYLPQSNWDKYFKNKVDCDDKYLNSRWKKIYDLRNKIAHTSHFAENDFDETNKLVEEVKTKLESAFKNIDSIELPENERENLSESIAVNLDENIGKFINQWNVLESYLRSITEMEYKSKPIISILNNLTSNNLLDPETIEEIHSLRMIRNSIVHNVNINSSETLQIPMYNEILASLNSKLQFSWKDEIINAIANLSNKAKLDEIYDYISSNTFRKMPTSWKSSIRKTLYLHYPKSKAFSGNSLFTKNDDDTWSLINT